MGTETVEVLVVGAGPAGSTAATLLAAAGHEAVLVDARTFPRDKTCGDALPPVGVATLQRLGLLAAIEPHAHRVDMLWMRGSHGETIEVPFEAVMPGAYALAIRRHSLDELLLQEAIRAGAHYCGDTRLTSLTQSEGHVLSAQVRGPDGQRVIQPRHVLVAVGANIGLLRRLGMLSASTTIMRGARCYMSNVSWGQDRLAFFFESHLAPGYGWIFPVGDNRANVGVVTAPTRPLHGASTESLLDQFIARCRQEEILEGAELHSRPAGYPIRVDFASTRVAGENWMLLGESAGLANPLTGEGIDLAILSGAIAAEAIRDCGSNPSLATRRYSEAVRQRYATAFRGLAVCRELFVNRWTCDTVIRAMRRDSFVRDRIVQITQGFEPPIRAAHPRFALGLAKGLMT